VKLVTTVIKNKVNPDEEIFRLKFINAGHLATAELSIGQAHKEIIHFAHISRNGLGYLKNAVEAPTETEFEKYRQKLVKYEEIADRIEFEIASFLNSIPQESISEQTSSDVKMMYKIIKELESLGDSGEAISRILSRRNIHGKTFTEQHIENLKAMIALVDKAYDIMIHNLNHTSHPILNLKTAINCEVEINELRNRLREEEILKIEQNVSYYQSSVYYLDTLSEIERMGDFIINISQAACQLK
jgi:phosphate:Na+ symporter